jgi:signal transduction histidine kinase
MRLDRLRGGILALGIAAGVLVAVVAGNSTRWIGRTFPGFLVMANRVIPSIALPDWSVTSSGVLFQQQVVALDDRPVRSPDEVYAHAAAEPPGTIHRYTVRTRTGATSTVGVRSRVFTVYDYAMLFGVYLSTGLAFLLTGLVVIWLKPDAAASRALLVQCLTTGVFVVTAADLYGPHWFFRVHVVAESLLAAGFIQLALVFPTDRLPRRRRAALAAVYAPFVALAIAYELALTDPAAYTTVHLIASASHGLGAVAIIAAVVCDVLTTRSPLVRRRVGVVALGTLGAFAVPGALMAASALLGGGVALNAGAFTAFLFPLSLGYAIVEQDLFEIDVVLRRAVSYAVALVAISAAYLAALSLVSLLIPLRTLPPLALAVINLLILFLMAPIKARAQDAVDRVFYRKAYDAERVLSELSHALSSARSLADVDQQTFAIVGEALRPTSAEILLSDDGATFRGADVGGGAKAVTLASGDAARLARGALVARYGADDARSRSLWDALDAELLVPVRSGSFVIAAMALGAKSSGRSYSEQDALFLAAAASQVAMAISNARAFSQLADMNVKLEDQVRERTGELEVANRDLNSSYVAMRSAFQQLEQSQTSLMRADRLATLGRLTAGIAHEVNTPLGAVLNALKILSDLGQEYRDSIDDPDVSADDHREIAREIASTADAAAGWARKAAAFISKVKMHGREPRPALRERFTVAAVVEETRALLAQRLRVECCALLFRATPADVALYGDPARLGQVLVNLVANALDAYEDGGSRENRIEVSAESGPDGARIRVQDWAGGIPPEVCARIFDELYTTKDPGRGTGLGLWIARNLVEESFGGTLTVESTVGFGSCFMIAVPPEALEPALPHAGAA